MEDIVKLSDLLSFTASFSEVIQFNWNIHLGTFVYDGMPLGNFNSSKVKYTIVSHLTGTIKNLPKNSHDTSEIKITECKHDMSYAGYCTYCGEPTKQMEQKSYRGFNSCISYSKARALQEEKKYVEKLLKNQKLILVLDIDHTLVHTCNGDCPDPAVVTEGEKMVDEMGYCYVVKVRPYLTKFLEIVKDLFEIYIYSYGSQRYANHIIKLIDPKGKAIRHDKVFGREAADITCKMKAVENLLPVDQSACIIIDDREDVWANKENLLRIFPYVYFKSETISYDRNLYPALSARSNDCSLFYFSNLLKNIHSLFYDIQNINLNIADVRVIIRLIRTYLLKGIRINLCAFEKASNKVEERKIISETGGIIEEKIENDVLVLAYEYNEENKIIYSASTQGIKIIDANWLILSDRYWWNLPLEPFIITKDKPKANVNEIDLTNNIQKNQNESKVWKYKNYKEILNEILSSEVKENGSPCKKKKCE